MLQAQAMSPLLAVPKRMTQTLRLWLMPATWSATATATTAAVAAAKVPSQLVQQEASTVVRPVLPRFLTVLW